MRVLMLTSEFIPVWGGIGTYVYEITRNLPQDYEVLVVTPRRARFAQGDEYEQGVKEKFPENVDIRYLTDARNTFSYNLRFQIAFARRHRRILEEFSPDVIHSQSSMPDLFINPSKVKIPIVTTIHTTVAGQIESIKNANLGFDDIGQSERMTLLFGPLIRPMEARYYAKRKHFITVSDYYADYLLKTTNIPESSLIVIHNGVDLDEYKASRSNEAEVFFPDLTSIDMPKILFLSRLIGIKGIHVLMENIEKVLNRADAHFIIAGSGRLDSASGNKENVSHIGYVPHEKTPYLYSLSDIFVLPSYHENCPLSLLEAMASGLAVVATDVGGIPEIVKDGDNGIIVSNDPKELTEAIIDLANNPRLCSELGQRARETVENSFSWKQSAEKTASYYEEVLHR